MEERKNLAVDILENCKKHIIAKDIDSARKYFKEYEELKQIPKKLVSAICQIYFYLNEFEKAHKYLVENDDSYYLGRFYLHFREYDKAINEFWKWADSKSDRSSGDRLIRLVYFAQGKYLKLVNLSKRLMASPDGIGFDFLDALTIALIFLSRSNDYYEFYEYLQRRHAKLARKLEEMEEIKSLYGKNYLNTQQNDLEKFISKLCSFPGQKLVRIKSTMDYIIQFEKYDGDLLQLVYENDPILKKAYERFIPSVEYENGFEIFETIVRDEIKLTPDYELKYNLTGLIDYFICSMNFTSALKLIRQKKNKSAYEMGSFVNLLFLANDDIIASDILDYPYFFFEKPLSKLILDTKDEFIKYLDEKLALVKKDKRIRFIDILTQQPPNSLYFQNSPLLNTHSSIYYSSPLYKSIKHNIITWYRINEDGLKFSKEYFKEIENDYRDFLGIRNIEFDSDCEAEVYYFVKKMLPKCTTILQYSPYWLRPQRADLYIQELNLIIEYQGEQHYRLIEHFGGVKGFDTRLKSDEKKYCLIKNMGINLEYIKYNESIEQRVIEIIKKYKSK
jgi:hypothetical protein